jgi:hypothetical protein
MVEVCEFVCEFLIDRPPLHDGAHRVRVGLLIAGQQRSDISPSARRGHVDHGIVLSIRCFLPSEAVPQTAGGLCDVRGSYAFFSQSAARWRLTDLPGFRRAGNRNPRACSPIVPSRSSSVAAALSGNGPTHVRRPLSNSARQVTVRRVRSMSSHMRPRTLLSRRPVEPVSTISSGSRGWISVATASSRSTTWSSIAGRRGSRSRSSP